MDRIKSMPYTQLRSWSLLIPAIALSLLGSSAFAVDATATKSAATFEDAIAVANAAMELLVAGKNQEAVDVLRPHVILPKSEMDRIMSELVTQRAVATNQFGKTLGFVLVAKHQLSGVVGSLTYIEKKQFHGVRWKFIFYRPADRWILSSFYWDDKIEEMLDKDQ